ncbi:MAG: hypothetical protein AAF753_06010 [Pseudomonadota bacterium]
MAWVTALGAVLAYGGCVLLFQGEASRKRHPAVVLPVEAMPRAKIAGWVCIVASAPVLCLPQGAERGIAVWIAAVAMSGVASLLVSALAPRMHLASVGGVAGICAATALVCTWLGAG